MKRRREQVANSWILQQRCWRSAASWHDYIHAWRSRCYVCNDYWHEERTVMEVLVLSSSLYSSSCLWTMAQPFIVTISRHERRIANKFVILRRVLWFRTFPRAQTGTRYWGEKTEGLTFSDTWQTKRFAYKGKWKKKGVRNRQKKRLNEKWAFIFWGNWMNVFVRQPESKFKLSWQTRKSPLLHRISPLTVRSLLLQISERGPISQRRLCASIQDTRIFLEDSQGKNEEELQQQ